MLFQRLRRWNGIEKTLLPRVLASQQAGRAWRHTGGVVPVHLRLSVRYNSSWPGRATLCLPQASGERGTRESRRGRRWLWRGEGCCKWHRLRSTLASRLQWITGAGEKGQPVTSEGLIMETVICNVHCLWLSSDWRVWWSTWITGVWLDKIGIPTNQKA